jgi:microcystin-dependent protein
MSYQINFTDSVNKGFIQVDENTVNTETSLDLPGRLKSDYGKLILENLLHLMENFANNNPPTNPIEGQLWYDTTVGIDQLKVYDGVQWVSASSIKKANSRPEAVESNIGDLWVDTQNQQLFLYNGNDWTLVGPDFSEGSNTGTKFEKIRDTTNIERSVATTFVNGNRLLILSDIDFTPKSTIAGFSIIKAGVNLVSGLKYYGIAETAENLIIPGEGNVLALNFARRDKDNTFTRPIRIQNNGGFSIGETPTLQMSVLNSNTIFRNLASDGDIQFRLTNESLSNTVLTIKSEKLVGINKNPTEALDVDGNIKSSGNLIASGTLSVTGAVDFGNNLTVTGDSTVGNVIVKNINPDQTGRNIGTSGLRFNNIFAQTVNAITFGGPSSTFSGTFSGTLNGSATSLTANTQFKLEGEVESDTITFGGVGNVGGVKTFNTTVSSAFITNRSQSASIDSNDEILIIRNNNQILRVKQEVLVSTIPPIQVGTIVMYGGETPPLGWLFCDGSVLSAAAYNILFNVIRYRFDPALGPSGPNFRLPDLRARFPLGNKSMNNLLDPNLSAPDSTTVSDPEASELGAKEGSETKTIQADNLPEHNHSLTSNGTAFYAITNGQQQGGLPNAPNIAGNLQSSGISQTGGVAGTIGEDLSVVNPYQTVNYIIYAGAAI